MKNLISKGSTLKSSVLFLRVTVFLMSAVLFTSCSDSEGLAVTDDTALIAKIESATKTSVAVDDLPAATATTFQTEFIDSAIENAELAAGFGYKVAMLTDNVAREEKRSSLFFSTEGRRLKDNSAKSKRRRHACFKFVFPIDFIMPDNSAITLNEKADWVLIKEWYHLNPDATERAAIVFPIEVALKDGTVQMVLDRDELKRVKKSCKEGKDKRKCFRLVLPVRFTMPDATVITVNERAEYKLIRNWHKANPNATEKGMLNYPVVIMYKNDTTANINDEAEMKATKEACKY